MSVALELWRALEAWDSKAKRWRIDKGLPGAGRFMPSPGGGSPGDGHSDRPSLADAVRGTAALGPKRQRHERGGMSVADAVRAAARQSDTTGRPTARPVAEHRAHGAHDVADEVDRALADVGAPEDVRQVVAGRSRARAESHGPRPDSLPAAEPVRPAAPPTGRSPEQVQRDIHLAVQDLLRDDPDGWASLADVRAAVDAPRQDVDAALHAMRRREGVRIIPVANTKSLQPRDREAALRIGDEDNHAIRIDSSLSPPTLGASKPSAPAASPNVPAPGPAELDNQVWDAYHELATDPGAFVALSRLRQRLDGNGASKADVDKSLNRLLDNPDVQLEPEDNQKMLRLEDRAAAVFIGGENRHLLQIHPGARRPSRVAPIPQKKAPTPPVTVPAAAPPVVDADALAAARAATDDARRQLADAIVNAPSRAAARDALSGLNARELRALADHLGATVGSKDTKPKLIDRLAEIPGRRLDSDAITSMVKNTPKPGDRARVPSVPSAPAVVVANRSTAARGADALKAAPISGTASLQKAIFGKPSEYSPDFYPSITHPNGMTSHQVESAIDDYSDQGYQYVNEALRQAKGDLDKLPERVSKGTHYTKKRALDDARGLDLVMAKSPLKSDIEVYRGVADPEKFLPGWKETGDNAGLEFTDHAYASTSVGTSVVRKFAGYGTGVRMNILVPKGTRAVGIQSAQPGLRNEKELLLDRGLRYRIVADRVVDGVRTVDVDVVPAA